MTTHLHLVMHGIAIKKHGDADAVASVTGLPVATVETVLADAVAGARVAVVDGKYMLTPAGQMIAGGEYSRFYDHVRGNVEFIADYERFERINKDLKQLITDWQMMEVGGKRITNDHSDADHDDRVIGRLGSLHERFEPILEHMGTAEARLGIYHNKLTHALERAERGEVAWVSDARVESYHTVWFELHEDLLRMLGRRREE